MPIAKEQIRQIISENNISSIADVYALLKDSFKEILQELMEAELDASLGYEKNQKGTLSTDNKRNGHSPKTLKSQYGEFQVESMFSAGLSHPLHSRTTLRYILSSTIRLKTLLISLAPQ